MIVLIPSYEPGPYLVPLVNRILLSDPGIDVVVVDDGSGPAFEEVFADARLAGATVLQHDTNRGKGAALKTGFRFVVGHHPGRSVVTADADGQHTPQDIERIAAQVRLDAACGDPRLVLGVRTFGRDVPPRSRFGNAVARGLFRMAAGWRSTDTQTGLRGIPGRMLPWMLEVPGERFEYEITVLLRLRGAGLAARELPIQTVYLEHNASSHFRPILDSLRVTLPLLLFVGSSLLAFLVDTMALLAFAWLLAPLLGASLVVPVIAARLVSASTNYAVNRRFVFRRTGQPAGARSRARYAVLALSLLAANILLVEALTALALPLLAAKVVTELLLYATSYAAQRRLVFGMDQRKSRPQAARAAGIDSSLTRHSSRIAATPQLGEGKTPLERNR